MKKEVKSKVKISSRQIAAARVLLGMTQAELAKAAGLNNQTVMALELARKVPHQSTIDAVREALERRGIEFTNGDEPGIKLVPGKAILPP